MAEINRLNLIFNFSEGSFEDIDLLFPNLKNDQNSELESEER